MAGERHFLRIPPDSTGKRVRLAHNVQLLYTNKTNGYVWKTDRWYPLTDGHVIHVHHVHETTTVNGVIDCSLYLDDQYDNYTPANGVGIKDPDTDISIANVDSMVDNYVNTTNIIGFQNPSHGVNVDAAGSMNVRFSEGIPQLDAFGKLRVSNSTLLGSYTFHHSLNPTKFKILRSHSDSGSQVVHNPTTVSADLVLDGVAGNYVSFTTNTYHHYFPGASQLSMMTLALSHNVLVGNEMRWGLFDENDGYGFVRDDAGVFKFFIRNSCDVDPDIEIPQSEWNGDKLDGTGESKMIIDLTMDNLYWFDIQWLGAGRVRFGVYHNGARVVCHEHHHNNTKPYPVCASGTLPIRYENTNTGTTAVTSILKLFCAAVYTEAPFSDVTAYGRLDNASFQKTIPGATTSSEDILVAVVAPAENFGGRQNRTLYWPYNLNLSAFDVTTGDDARFRIRIVVEPIVSGLNFYTTGGGYILENSVQASTAGTYYGTGADMIMDRTCHGACDLDFKSVYNNMSESAVRNYASNGGYTKVNFDTVTAGASTMEVTWSTPVPFREAYPISLMGIEVDSVSSAVNGSEYPFNRYIKITGQNSAEVWANADYTVPVTLEAGTVTNTGHAHGYFGTRFYWAIIVNKLQPTSNDIQVNLNVAWKELRQ